MRNCWNWCKTGWQPNEDRASLPAVKTTLWLLPLVLLAPLCAHAQVQINPAALRQLQGLPLVSAPASAAKANLQPLHQNHSPPQPAALPASTTSPPAEPAVASSPVRTAAPKAAEAPQPAKADTATHVPALPPMVTIKFAAGSAALPADSAAILKAFCTTQDRIPILAKAPATPDNPGNGMQLSAQRALAVRAALIACGVPAQNIIPQASVDISAMNSNVTLIGAHSSP